MTYILTKNGHPGNYTVVLISSHAPEGARHSRNSTLPHTQGEKGKEMTGSEFVRTQLLNPGGDPDLACDEPDQLVNWATAFLTSGTPPDFLKTHDTLRELENAGVKVPKLSEVQPGPRLLGRG